MANALYAIGRQKFLQADIDWLVGNIEVLLVDAADYVINLATHDFLDDVTAVGIVANSRGGNGPLGTKTATNGTADAADITWNAVTGDVSELIIVYENTAGVDTTDPLICAYDTATGLPVTPNGGNITVQWHASGLFTL